MNTSIGIDIGKRKCDVCVVDGKGKVLERRQYLNREADVYAFAHEMARKYRKGKCRAACETTGNMWNLTFDAFEKAGIDIKLANTYKMAIISKTAKKTDKVDAEKIAQVLRMNMIPECYVPSLEVRGTRTMIRQRIRLVQDRTRVINRVHTLLDRYGKTIDASDLHSAKAIRDMESLSLDSKRDESILRLCARQIQYLTGEITLMNKQFEKEASQNDDAKLLTSMTGIGINTAMLLASEIGDIARFESAKKMVSWAGLCPTIHQSGDQKYLGKMKKLDTNKIVNWAMCEAANVAVRHDPRMKVAYEKARRRHADKHALAIVVVAKKMTTIAWHMLATRTLYESRNEDVYKRKLLKIEKARRR